MIDVEVLKAKLMSQLDKLNLSEEEKNIVVIELNKLAEIFIKAYLRKNEK